MKQIPAKVLFHYREVKFPFVKRTLLKNFIISLFRKEGKALESMSYIFCSDEFLLDMNNNYLKHNYYTDIITFDLSETQQAPVIGEAYISIDRVTDNAKKLSVEFDHELLRVVFHGALHLCGYGDKTRREEELMRKKEQEYIDLYLKGIK